MQRWRALSEAELRTKVPASGAPSLVKTIGSSYSMYPPSSPDDSRYQLIRELRYVRAVCLIWTRAAFVHPLSDFSDELGVTERWRASSLAWIPSPQHEWVVVDVVN